MVEATQEKKKKKKKKKAEKGICLNDTKKNAFIGEV